MAHELISDFQITNLADPSGTRKLNVDANGQLVVGGESLQGDIFARLQFCQVSGNGAVQELHAQNLTATRTAEGRYDMDFLTDAPNKNYFVHFLLHTVGAADRTQHLNFLDDGFGENAYQTVSSFKIIQTNASESSYIDVPTVGNGFLDVIVVTTGAF